MATNNNIPTLVSFIPQIDGEFKSRFYNAVKAFTKDLPPAEKCKIAEQEIYWVENECRMNLNQRKRYRAIWSLLKDLINGSWNAEFINGVLYMRMPQVITPKDAKGNDAIREIKDKIRGWMKENRQEKINISKPFIDEMERSSKNHKGIINLIAEGPELFERLEKVKNGHLSIEKAIVPYLQLVNDEKDPFTGLRLRDIWRYFRLTWSNPAENTPGRTLQYLVRDAASPNHAIMGIASLENCPLRILDRDKFIGWEPESFISNYGKSPSAKKESIHALLRFIDESIEDIDYSKICKEDDVRNPTSELIDKLSLSRITAIDNSNKQLRIPMQTKADRDNYANSLFNKKRVVAISKLLTAKYHFLKLLQSANFIAEYDKFIESKDGIKYINDALLAHKSRHIGSSMMELNVCGAIPPYNEILSGKLVALLALSPQVIHDYKTHYQNSKSEIASRMKNKSVIRPADLAYIGTTSLYSIGSSQYNRLKIPKSLFNSTFDVKWLELGKTTGYGTLHISKLTTKYLNDTLDPEQQHSNHIMGEGASPKLRLITTALTNLLFTNVVPSPKEFTKHAMPRIVYGACLAENSQEYLMGKEETLKYYTNIGNYETDTQKIINFWRTRWLKSRLNYSPIFTRIKNYKRESLLIGEVQPRKLEQNAETLQEENLPAYDDDNLKFIRGFYRGTSAYADRAESNHLKQIHIKTELDDAILEAVQKGMDVILTGNPGDGKTHIMRALHDELASKGIKFIQELDASTKSNDELFNEWIKTDKEHIPFLLAINAAVLYSLYDYCKKNNFQFAKINEAYQQLSNSIVYHNEPTSPNQVVVFDLSKRNILTQSIVKSAISKLTDEKLYSQCHSCPHYRECSATINRNLLNDDLFQKRLCTIFEKISYLGFHATLRELQSFISYLIFANKSCDQLGKEAGSAKNDIVNLIYGESKIRGKGLLFKALCKTMDPKNISHPIWDENLLSNQNLEGTWSPLFKEPLNSIPTVDLNAFELRKRQFYFFNQHGEELLKIQNDDVTQFQQFLTDIQDPDKSKICLKQLVTSLNRFFTPEFAGKAKALRVWIGHRYNNEPRHILISQTEIPVKQFSIGIPKLSTIMNTGIKMPCNFIRLELKTNPRIHLKIDYKMYALLKAAQNGVPVLFTSSNLTKNIWRFMELLQNNTDVIDNDEIDIHLKDIQTKNEVQISIDCDENKYSSIKSVQLNSNYSN